jgi:hypothetical protein
MILLQNALTYYFGCQYFDKGEGDISQNQI